LTDPSGAGGTHDPARRARHVKNAAEIHGEHLGPLIIRHFVQHRVAIDPGIVHQDVEPAKLLVNALDQRVALTRIRNVQSRD